MKTDSQRFRFDWKIVKIVLPISYNIYVLDAQKNCLIETVLLSAHDICFSGNKKNVFSDNAHLSRGLKAVSDSFFVSILGFLFHYFHLNTLKCFRIKKKNLENQAIGGISYLGF